ncbi:MAG: imidazole glycerol phosphate synthase subunit HisH [Thermoleophilia bacterium]
MIYIIDYGSGNLRSVQKAFEKLGYRADVGDSARSVRQASGLVLPGVGAFGHAMHELSRRGLVEPIRQAAEEGVPFLGVCLGLQLLFEASEESPGVEGLGIVPGDVRRLPGHLKVPHIGWNQIEMMKASGLLDGIPDHAAFYFVHSYVVVPAAPAHVLTVTDYGGYAFTSSILKDNVAAFQFHPEKSSLLGLKIYRNFAREAGS